jgi:hypothetical protein
MTALIILSVLKNTSSGLFKNSQYLHPAKHKVKGSAAFVFGPGIFCSAANKPTVSDYFIS